ncbi:hypothetical protein [Arthrobacter sp. D5-1]|uniref:helix-turn-helix domain-containing protein n=1 Tax=Arthrobacter sp. D5-1 TaxID=1477518 RepID=UPI001A989D35|nr:hypothetical protein [Arthrobacter sp. D5-1]QSZ49590.1 hypothetical protein AYX22_15055 [Arthrobacter sp. D5-1]
MSVRDEQIGQNIVRLRGERSQQWVADRMREKGWKWAQATVWNVEKGERPLRLAEAEGLADILAISVEQILQAPDVLGHEDQLQIWTRDIESSFLKIADLTEELLGQLELLGYALEDLPDSMDSSNYWVDLAVKAQLKTPEQAVVRGRAEREMQARGLKPVDVIAEFGSVENWFSTSTSSREGRDGEHPEA